MSTRGQWPPAASAAPLARTGHGHSLREERDLFYAELQRVRSELETEKARKKSFHFN